MLRWGNALHSDSSIKHIEETNKKDPNFKIVDHSEFLNTKIFFLKVIYLIGAKKFSLLIKYKIPFLGLI